MITAHEAHKASDKNRPSDKVVSQIDFLNYWVGAATRNGLNDLAWFVPEEFTEEEVMKVVKSFWDRGFETEKIYGFMRTWKFFW